MKDKIIVKPKFNKLELMLFILLLLCCFQNISIININETFSLKLFHCFSLLFLPYLIKKKTISIPSIFITLFIIYMIVISILMIPFYGFNSLLFNYIFSFYILVIICTLGKDIQKEKWMEIIKKVAWIMIISVCIKLFVYYDEILYFLSNPYGHPAIPTFFGGGVNLEITWLGLLGFSFYNDKKAYIYSTLILIISAIYASRIGIILVLFLFLFITFQNGFKLNKKQIKRITLALIFSIFVFYFVYNSGVLDYVLNRFSQTGLDPGSTGRLSMWKYVTKAFDKNPIGYGLGNSINAIELISGYKFKEGNVHNLFFQMLLDGGIIGLIYYVILLLFLFKDGIKNFLHNPFLAFLIVYFILSVTQFRGGDVIMFYVLGVYIVTLNSFKIEKKGDLNNEDTNKSSY